MKKRYIEILILIGSFAFIWLAFTLFPLINNKTVPNMPVKTEEKFGELLFNEYYNDSNNVVKDPIVVTNVDSITQLLLSKIPQTKYRYKVVIVRSPWINAFALPGGYIVVFSSLIAVTDSPEELAAVLAHEIGHIEKHHVFSKIMKDEMIAVLFSGKGGMASKLTTQLSTNAFDRKSEAEADDFSLELLEKCNISPRHTGDFFRRLKDTLGDTKGVLTLLSNHPDLQSRIEKSYNYKVSSAFQESKLELNWELVKSIVKRYYTFR